jgi:hypothetical protein
MDPSKSIDDKDKCKNLKVLNNIYIYIFLILLIINKIYFIYIIFKDYAWKSVRIISKFFLKDMKTTNMTNNKIPDLEELTR